MNRKDSCNWLSALYRDIRLLPGRLQDSVSTTFVYLVYGWNESETRSIFMYIYHLFSIVLQSSCSCNSSHCKAYSYKPGLPTVLHLIFTFSAYWAINLLPHSRSHYFFHLCSVSSFFKYQIKSKIEHRTSIKPSVRTSPTDERTDQSNQKFGTS